MQNIKPGVARRNLAKLQAGGRSLQFVQPGVSRHRVGCRGVGGGTWRNPGRALCAPRGELPWDFARGCKLVNALGYGRCGVVTWLNRRSRTPWCSALCRRQCGGLCRLKKGRRWKIKKPLGRSTGQTIVGPTSELRQSPDTPTLDAHFSGVGDMATELVR